MLASRRWRIPTTPSTCCWAWPRDLSEENPDDIDLDAVLDVPVVYASGKAGRAIQPEQPDDGALPDE